MSRAGDLNPPFIAVSLKMYFDHSSTIDWARAVRLHPGIMAAVESGDIDLVLFPGHVSLDAVGRIFEGTAVRLGAQDLSWASSGAFTGDVDGASIRQVGASFAEVGHVERRTHHQENLERAGDKLAAALRSGLRPLVCVGEDNPTTPRHAAARCAAQWDAMLARLSAPERATLETSAPVIAYEPVWAIGARESAEADYVQTVIARLPHETGLPQGTQLIYGGSAGTEIVAALGATLDGFFLGRRAHDPNMLAAIIQAARSSHA